MTNEEIIRMALKVGFGDHLYLDPRVEHYEDEVICLERFAALVAAAEREACAKVCDEQEQRSRESSEKSKRERDKFMYHHCAVTAKWNAAAIRARGQ